MNTAHYIEPVSQKNAEEKAERKDIEDIHLVRKGGWMGKVSGRQCKQGIIRIDSF